jgi:hypothetical protein
LGALNPDIAVLRISPFEGWRGFPTVNDEMFSDPREVNREADVFIDENIILGAPLWHDWAKTMVFQWTANGTEFTELNFGGTGTNDNYGTPGDSRTGGHHIITIAEEMARDLSPEFVITMASAHSAPTSGNEYKVVNWLRAGAIIAQIDPVAKGYLYGKEAENRVAEFEVVGGRVRGIVAKHLRDRLQKHVIGIDGWPGVGEVGIRQIVDGVLGEDVDGSGNLRLPPLRQLGNNVGLAAGIEINGERLLMLYSEKGINLSLPKSSRPPRPINSSLKTNFTIHTTEWPGGLAAARPSQNWA